MKTKSKRMKALTHAYTHAVPVAVRTQHPYTITVRDNGAPASEMLAYLKWTDSANFHVCYPNSEDPNGIPIKFGDTIEVDLPFIDRYVNGLLGERPSPTSTGDPHKLPSPTGAKVQCNKAADTLTEMDDLLHRMHQLVWRLSFTNSDGELELPKHAIAEELNNLDAMVESCRLLLFQAHANPVLLACIKQILAQEGNWAMGRQEDNLTQPVMEAITKHAR